MYAADSPRLDSASSNKPLTPSAGSDRRPPSSSARRRWRDFVTALVRALGSLPA